MYPVRNAVICAAGMGTRLGLNMPKCLVRINGRCVIDYILDLLSDFNHVRIVVGFMEEEVIRHVNSIRKDVVFVRNPYYRKTTNSHSLKLGSNGLKEPYVSIDGDMIIEEKSFNDFLNFFDGRKHLIGVSDSKSEEAVFVNIDKNYNVIEFQRTPSTMFEWCGIAIIVPPLNLDDGYVYENLIPELPLPSKPIVCYEIDTQKDLELVKMNIDSISKL